MTEYLVQHNWSHSWSSVTIPTSGDALVVSADDTGTVCDTSSLSRESARTIVEHCIARPNEYTVTEVN